jgi:DNA-binding ferritin-like protein
MKHLKLFEDYTNTPEYWLDYQTAHPTEDKANEKHLTSILEVLTAIGESIEEFQENSEEEKIDFPFADILAEVGNFFEKYKWINRCIIDAIVSQTI